MVNSIDNSRSVIDRITNIFPLPHSNLYFNLKAHLSNLSEEDSKNAKERKVDRLAEVVKRCDSL